jgi:hypothetical protein
MRTPSPPPLPLSQSASDIPVTLCSAAADYLQKSSRAPKTPNPQNPKTPSIILKNN